MNYRPILVVHGEPNSIFLEIFFKSIKIKKYKSPIILICSKKILNFYMKKFKIKKKIKLIKKFDYDLKKLNNKCINLVDVKCNLNLKNTKISQKSSPYIEECFNVSFKILNLGITDKFINGPISKKSFLNKKYLGITEYLSKKFKSKSNAMLIYNEKLSVCPLTTHMPIKFVAKKINKNTLIEKVKLINDFYIKKIGFKPKIGVLGLNPHCESIHSFNEDDKILKPVINKLIKRKFNISGPYSADTFFLKDNRKNYNVVIGMYHDQVLTPLKTLYEYNAINITLGLPFTRISPDHGPNEKMVGQNLSNPLSLIKAIKFLDKN